MAQAVLMPQVGQDIETAVLVEWTVKVGDAVKPDDVIALVESDKATFEVQALEEGILLKQLLAEGEESKVLTPIAWIGHPGEEIESETIAGSPLPSAAGPESKRATTAGSVRSVGEHIAVAPSARRIAREQSVDLSTVTGTGPGGRILKEDVLAAVGAKPATQVIAFSKLRRKVAERLTHSKQDIPHFYLHVDVNMSEALQWRRDYNDKAAIKVTVTDIILQAVGWSLARFPKLNAHVFDDKMVLHRDINIGVAVSVEDGLVVPVVARADTLSLEQISQQVRESVDGARGGVLKPQATGTFTVSNLGMHGVGMFLPIINPPECAILGVGTVTQRPWVTEAEQLGVANVMTLALACDHRGVDGTYAAAFLDEVKKILEHFSG